MKEEVFIANSFEETQKLGEKFAQRLRGGDIVALYGELGSGKTTFVQGLAKGLGIERRIISPTFIIVRSYKIGNKNVILASEARPESKRDAGQASMTNVPLLVFYHIDLYRIKSKKGIAGLGIEEIMNDPQNIVAIEWAEKIAELLPKERTDIYFEYLSDNKRKILIKNV